MSNNPGSSSNDHDSEALPAEDHVNNDEDRSAEASATSAAGSSGQKHSKVDTAALLAELEKKNQVHGRQKTSYASAAGLFLLIVVLAGTGGWFTYQQWLAQKEYEASLAELGRENAQMREQLEQARSAMSETVDNQVARLSESESLLQQAVAEIDSNAEADAQRLEELQNSLNRNMEGVASRLSEDMRDVTTLVSALQGQVTDLQNQDLGWLNSEANYLMRLAQRKLAMEADVASAMLLLKTVEDLLSRQDSMLANTARDSVRRDIQRLEALRLPDRVGIAERLNDLSRELDSLSLSSSRQAAYVESVQQRLAQGEAGMESWWAAALNLIRTVFVWREADPDQSVSLMPDQEQLVKQQMLLQLEQARLAVVQADAEMYQITLDQLQAIMQRYLNQDSAQAVQLVSELNAMRDVEVTTTLPTLTDSVNLVRQLAADSVDGGE
ncbi:MAG: uroporphyrinogen-III C-methyltransferase [Pseudohongiella nitratireducens]|nr:uroporphyrinogen-III C-methyltransferase [Pseudohongiella nitratireducens]